jgi:hypothetical protein
MTVVITVPWQKLLPGYSLGQAEADLPDHQRARRHMVPRTTSPIRRSRDLIDAAKKNPARSSWASRASVHASIWPCCAVQEVTGTRFNLVLLPRRRRSPEGSDPFEGNRGGDHQPRRFRLADPIGRRTRPRRTSEARNATYPDVPTAKELGVDIQIGSFILLAAPAGTPDDIVQKLEKDFKVPRKPGLPQVAGHHRVSPTWLGTAEVAHGRRPRKRNSSRSWTTW